MVMAGALALSGAANAAALQVSGGQLFGASDVLVDGQLYDVAFMDGTCVEFYSGCDEVSDFAFQTEAAAVLAGQALIDRVFLDIPGLGLFDTEPALTNGITHLTGGASVTPYAFDGAGGVMVQSAFNRSVPFDNVQVNHFGPLSSTASLPSFTYAVWTPVPEPGTALLVGAGLIGLGWRGRRER